MEGTKKAYPGFAPSTWGGVPRRLGQLKNWLFPTVGAAGPQNAVATPAQVVQSDAWLSNMFNNWVINNPYVQRVSQGAAMAAFLREMSLLRSAAPAGGANWMNFGRAHVAAYGPFMPFDMGAYVPNEIM